MSQGRERLEVRDEAGTLSSSWGITRESREYGLVHDLPV